MMSLCISIAVELVVGVDCATLQMVKHEGSR